ncbi:MAG: DUF7507 domain-containing protein, partial [Actinomycetota bacterium]
MGWKSILLLSLLPFSAAVLFSVHDDGLFELGDGAVALTAGSGDILGDIVAPLQPGCDWADLFPDANPSDDDFDARAAACGGITSVFIADDLSTSSLVDDTVFAQSNKNIDQVGTWNWDTGNNPPKDDLANVYAFATLNSAEELIVYVGLERLAEDGDSHIDIEFNQDTVGLDKDPACGSDGVLPDNDSNPLVNDGAPCEFTGEKTDDDLLLVMDFEQGGALGLVRRFQWNDPDGTPGTGDETLDQILPELGGQGCIAGDTICAVNNGGSIDGGPWPNFNRHGAVVTNLPANAFTEVGVNVTQTLGMTPCFGTIQVHSRSSQSVSSELKDFALHNFSICGIEIVKEGPGLSKIGDEVTYDFTITNTGGVELHLVSVNDDQIGDITSEADAAGCDPLGPGASCNFSVAFVIPGDADDPFVNVVTATYNSAADESGAELADDDDHSVNLFQPSVEILKDGDTLSKVGDEVAYDFTI